MPQEMNQLVKDGYNKAAENYAAGRDQFKNVVYLEKFSELLKPNSRVLDIGCGNGKPVDSFLVEHGHHVVGIDISEKQLELARKNLPDQEFELKDMSLVEPRAYKVDAIVSFYAIFHIPKQEHGDLFKKMNSFLPIDGPIVITLGNDDWEGSEDDFFGAKMYWSQNTKEENDRLLKAAGFETILDEVDDSGGEKHRVIIAKKIKDL